MIFIIIVLFTGAIFKYKLPPQAPLLLFIEGMILYFLNKVENYELNESLSRWENISSTTILNILLPPLIYKSSSHIDFHIFKKYLKQYMILVLPILIINAFVGTLMIKYVNEFNWNLSFLFGFIISSTDPVSVLSILEHQNMSNKIKTLIDGEALLNDVVVYLAYKLINDSLRGAVFQIFYIPLGSILCGSILFFVIFQMLRNIYDSDIEIALTFIFCYGNFYISELLNLSGIFSTVIFGLWMSYIGKTAISSSINKSLEYVWETIDTNLNHIIFTLCGLISMKSFYLFENHWYKVILIYFGITTIRIISILLFYKILQHSLYKIYTKELGLLSISNIKGAVTITLALSLTEVNSSNIHNREIILFYTFGVTFLTLLINPIFIKLYIKYVLKHQYLNKGEYLVHIRERLHNIGKNAKKTLYNQNKYLGNINWPRVEESIITSNSVNNIHIDINDVEYRIIYLTSLKKNFWKLFDNHLLYRNSVIDLIDTIDNVLDTDDKNWRACFEKYCKYPKFYLYLPRIIRKRILYHEINYKHNMLMGYILGHQMTIQSMFSMFPKKSAIIEKLRNEEKESIKYVKKFIQKIDNVFPEITIKIETRQAIYYILKKQQRFLKKNFKEGKINYYIYNHINKEINSILHY